MLSEWRVGVTVIVSVLPGRVRRTLLSDGKSCLSGYASLKPGVQNPIYNLVTATLVPVRLSYGKPLFLALHFLLLKLVNQ